MRNDLGQPLPNEIAGRQAMFDAAPELQTNGQWICLNIQPNVTWPVRAQSFKFDGHRLWIIPLTLEDHPGIALNRNPGMSQEDAESILLRFLSVLSWRESEGIAVTYRTGGNLPRMMGLNKQRGFAIRDEFDFTEVLCPLEESARVALALVREARSLNHHGYAFLSYWRVLELAYPDTNARVAWMTATLPTLTGRGVAEALSEIAAQGIADVGKHLFTSGRCAIAHATGQPVINPDDPRDALRLYRELPLVREMAIRAIEDRFGIDTPSKEWSKHLFELRGWKAALGTQVVSSILAGEDVQSGQLIELPIIHVRLRGNPPYRPLENMIPKYIEQQGQELQVVYSTADDLCEIRFRLALREERLKFDFFNGIFGQDDGSVTAAVYKREIQRFFRDYLLNGELQMWDADSGALLSRLGAYIPLNNMVDLDGCNANIAAAQGVVEQREALAGQAVE